jgi:hypothetical protein
MLANQRDSLRSIVEVLKSESSDFLKHPTRFRDAISCRSDEESSEGPAFFNLIQTAKAISWSNEVTTDPPKLYLINPGLMNTSLGLSCCVEYH